MPRSTSIPAFDLQDQRLKQRMGRVAGYQIANFTLAGCAVFLAAGWGYTAYALNQNAAVIQDFRTHPVIVKENDLGQTALFLHADLNTSPDARSIESALRFWAMYHYDHCKFTADSFRQQSFAWMSDTYGAAIKQNDRNTHYIENILKTADQQYRIAVKHAVITETEHKKGQTMSGAADIYAYKQFVTDDGIAQPVKPQDAIIIHATWQQAIGVDDKYFAVNPLGIAVTYATVNPSYE